MGLLFTVGLMMPQGYFNPFSEDPVSCGHRFHGEVKLGIAVSCLAFGVIIAIMLFISALSYSQQGKPGISARK